MTLTIIILATLALFIVQLFLQETSLWGFSPAALMGTRDNPPEKGIIAARLERAKNNMMESLPLFLGVALLALIKQGDGGAASHGALLFLVARTLYVPAYASGVFAIRSLLWLASVGGLVWMVVTLL